MVKLSAEKINVTAPYKVMIDGEGENVVFETDYEVHYIVGFETFDLLKTAETYQFYITNTNNKKSPRDWKLKETIMAVVENFFESSSSAMLYICDTGDGRQAMRDRLFRYWMTESRYYSKINTVTGSVIDEDGIGNFASLVIRNDHPKKQEVVSEFLASIDLLNNKPQ